MTQPEGIPEDGTYSYDIAFAEWNGKTLGDKVNITISGDQIEVVYAEGNLSNTEPGYVFVKGVIKKHKSGAWIICETPDDINASEVGGCVDGPYVIDFDKKLFWLC
ncbi:MAG: hypothetical protein SchgKO_22680 [Schleiferiaceae bacterium]